MTFWAKFFQKEAGPVFPVPPGTTPKARKAFSLAMAIAVKRSGKVKKLIGPLFSALESANLDSVAVIDEVERGVDENVPPAATPNGEVIGVSLMMLSIIFLTYAEATREVRETRKQWIVSGDPKESQLWRSCAHFSEGLARLAFRYLGETSGPIVDTIVARAEKQEAISLSEAKSDPRFKTQIELITALPMQTVSIYADWVFAIDRCSLTLNDMRETVHSLDGHQVLLKYLV